MTLIELIPALLQAMHGGGEAMADFVYQFLGGVPVAVRHQMQEAIA